VRRSTPVVAALAAVTFAAATGPAAYASQPTAADRLCAVEYGPDPSLPDVYHGTLGGGPIAQAGELRCSIRVNGVEAAAAAASSATAPTTVPRTLVSWVMGPNDVGHLCTRFIDSIGQDWYYDGIGNTWTTNANAPCENLPVASATVPTPTPAVAYTTVSWSKTATNLTPTFTPPVAAGSSPPSWTCTTSFPATGHARASCEPVAGQPQPPGTSGWGCYAPYATVQVQDPALSTGGSVTGVTSCDLTVVGCTATTSTTQPAASCSDVVWAPRVVPFVCEAFYGSVAPGATWIVRCGPLDP
jgi:hypothetical protein